MEQLVQQMLEKAKTDKKSLLILKNMAVQMQQYELAAELRGIEIESFPESEEVKQSKHEAKQISTVFKMVGLNIPDDTAWMILAIVRKYEEKKGDFSTSEAADIEIKTKNLFDLN